MVGKRIISNYVLLLVGSAFLQLTETSPGRKFAVYNVDLPKFVLEHFAFGCYLVNLNTLTSSIFAEKLIQKYIKKRNSSYVFVESK